MGKMTSLIDELPANTKISSQDMRAVTGRRAISTLPSMRVGKSGGELVDHLARRALVAGFLRSNEGGNALLVGIGLAFFLHLLDLGELRLGGSDLCGPLGIGELVVGLHFHER